MKFLPGLVALLLWLGVVGVSDGAVATQARGENFDPVPCATFKLSDVDFECGYVRVPELHADPTGRQIRLATAILPGTHTSPTRDAFVVAQGGPGGSTLDTFATFFEREYYPAIANLRAARDIVLYDQRGTLYAQPALLCPEELELTLATLDQEIPPDASLRQYEHAALECRERLVKDGVNLAAYNSVENALDIEDVRRALGYEQLDLYGVSYGTLLALHGLRETPATFRSVILDAVVPAQVNPNAVIAQSEDRAFKQLFRDCAANADCNRAYPDLERVFYGVVDALNQTPARVPLTNDDPAEAPGGKTYNAVIDGDGFMDLLFQFIYNTEILPALPQMIYDAREGRYTLVEAFYPHIVFDRTFASGMYYSVMCAEDADMTIDDLALDGVDPHIAKAQTRDTAAFLQLCEKWDVPQLGARADEPVTATVSTLVLSGDLDPITPPPNGETAAATITPSYVYEFPAYGHGAMTSGNCPNEMIAAFVQNPERAPDALCIREDAARIPFVTPAHTILDAGTGKLQYAMLQGKLAYFAMPIVLILILLSVWLVAPLAWLIRHSQHRPSEATRLARLAPWLAAGASAIAALFFVIVFALVILIALENERTIELVLGAPREWLLVYLMPLAYALLAIAFAAATAVAWVRGSWGIWRRIYFSVLTAAALGLIAWFGWTGLLFSVFS